MNGASLRHVRGSSQLWRSCGVAIVSQGTHWRRCLRLNNCWTAAVRGTCAQRVGASEDTLDANEHAELRQLRREDEELGKDDEFLGKRLHTTSALKRRGRDRTRPTC